MYLMERICSQGVGLLSRTHYGRASLPRVEKQKITKVVSLVKMAVKHRDVPPHLKAGTHISSELFLFDGSPAYNFISIQ